MWHLKLFAVLMICLLLLGQIDGSPISELSSAKRRLRRMTPFWRGVSLRPIGASCRDDSECITRLCRTLQEDAKTGNAGTGYLMTCPSS
ncbi:liver-expressed antimicrobial peptide 2 [Eptesicus fuscus]|uniref:liver-expressed antimicrobial peptide 2 n=1 Tax=Eptesicus fuscus TaxID=29078 RepID=UPI002403EED2|nr:liver-expressed antimicrobial peptide 2 [Eptesicus fuscus]